MNTDQNDEKWESKEEWQKEEERRHENEHREKEEEARGERERKEEQRHKFERATLVKAIISTASVAALLGIIAPSSLYFVLFVVAWAIVTYPFRRIKSSWILFVIYVIAPIVVLALSTQLKDRYDEQKLDREVKWKDVKPYDVTKHGIELGEVTVLGQKFRVTFYLWGIAKESYLSDDDQPRIIGEMTTSPSNNNGLGSLNELALAASNHGCSRVILTKNIAYLVTSDLE